MSSRRLTHKHEMMMRNVMPADGMLTRRRSSRRNICS
jgi:hypothetical protein